MSAIPQSARNPTEQSALVWRFLTAIYSRSCWAGPTCSVGGWKDGRMEDRTAGKSILQETTDSSCVTGKIGFVLFFLSHYHYQAGLIWLNGKFHKFFFLTSMKLVKDFFFLLSSPSSNTHNHHHTHTPDCAVSNLFCFFFFLSLFFSSCDLTHASTQGPEAWTLLSVWLTNTQQVTKRFYTRLKQSV